MESYLKCLGCKCLRNEATEFEVYKGKRRLTCIICKANRIKLKCEHQKRKSQCKECGGSSFCEHQRQKSQCKECGGGSICEHQRIRSQCKECGGSKICEHKRIRTQCKDCGGSKISEHQRQKSLCKECGGSQICEHQKRRSICKECEGSSICEHQKRSSQCKICSPHNVIINLIRCQVRRCFNISTLNKINHSIEYLGCDVETLKRHIQDKMTDQMTFDNIHYDHIKPVSCFNLDDEEEFLKCCHFTNLQPLLAKNNLELSNKWTDENEIFWNEHILYKPDYTDLYKI